MIVYCINEKARADSVYIISSFGSAITSYSLFDFNFYITSQNGIWFRSLRLQIFYRLHRKKTSQLSGARSDLVSM
jgi:hypothetical protein